MGMGLLLLPSPNNLKSRIPIPSPKSQSYAMSRSSYPSAHGRTPSYRSAASTVYPSALGSDKLWPQAEKDFHTTFHFPQTGSFSSGLSSRSTLSTDLDRDMARHVNSSLSTSTRSPLNTTTHSGSSSSYKTEKYSSSSVSSANGACHTGKATTTRLTGALGLATQGSLTQAMPTQHHRSTVTVPTRTPSPTSHTTFKPFDMDNVVLKKKNQMLTFRVHV